MERMQLVYPVIEMDNINKAYGKDPNLVKVLNNVTLTVNPGEFVAY